MRQRIGKARILEQRPVENGEFAIDDLQSGLNVNAGNGNIIATLPTAMNIDTVAFNPATTEAISAATGGSMVFIKEKSPTSFVEEQRLQTMLGARTLDLDTKTNHLLTMAFEYGPLPANAPPPPVGGVALGPVVPGSFSILMMGKQ